MRQPDAGRPLEAAWTRFETRVAEAERVGAVPPLDIRIWRLAFYSGARALWDLFDTDDAGLPALAAAIGAEIDEMGGERP